MTQRNYMTQRNQDKLLKYFYKAIKDCPIPFTARAILKQCEKHPRTHWRIVIDPSTTRRRRRGI